MKNVPPFVRWLAASGLALLAMRTAAAEMGEAPPLRTKPALLRMSYEVLELSPSETMGLAGVHYLVNVHPDWYVGASGFGAMHGERGGFFTGGFTLGTGRRFASHWMVDAGFFVGGGGGGSAPQGGGLMLRPHLTVSRDVGGVMLGAGISHVRFPDGDIDGTQAHLTLGIPFDLHYARAADAGRTVHVRDLAGLRLKRSEWSATLGEYRPSNDARTTAGDSMDGGLRRVGFEYRRLLDGRRYFFVETAGAMGGQSDGFAELLAGVGYRLPLASRLHLTGSVAVGAAGGGQVDTGGGTLGKLRLGLDYALAPALRLSLEGGWIESGGSFGGTLYSLGIGYRLGDVGSGGHGGDAQAARVQLARWRLGGVLHTNLDAARKDERARDLSLVGLKLEKFVTPSVYLTGQAHGGFAGGAGGYAVGLIGAGWETPLRADGRLRFNAELCAGAAGGGGVDVGAGAVLQPQVGLGWRLDPQFAVRLEAGRVMAPDGRLDSNSIGIGLLYEFSRPEYGHERY